MESHNSNGSESDDESLYQATLDWLASSTGQDLSSSSINEVFKDGKIFMTLMNALSPSSVPAPSPSWRGDSPASPIASKESNSNNFFVLERVDEFLKFCKSMGVKDHELFSGSDIVTSPHNWKRVCLSLSSLARECSKQGMEVKKFDSGLSRRKETGSPDKNSVVQRYMDQLQSNAHDHSSSRDLDKDINANKKNNGQGPLEKKKSSRSPLRCLIGSGLVLFILVGTGVAVAKAKRQVRVRSGDSLWTLAQKRNQSIENILAANTHLQSNPSLIFPDEIIALRP